MFHQNGLGLSANMLCADTLSFQMMMTTDMALVNDAAYKEIVQEYANDIGSLNKEFAAAWEKLVTDGTNWAHQKKCIDVSYSWKNNGTEHRRNNDTWVSGVW